MIKIGVTGTREGATENQLAAIRSFLQTTRSILTEVPELHHGDCCGVDGQVAAIAKELGYVIVCHPPIKDDMRGFFESDIYIVNHSVIFHVIERSLKKLIF